MIGALVFAFAAAISGWAWLQSGDLVHLVSGSFALRTPVKKIVAENAARPAAPRWINALALVGAVLLLVGLVLRFWPR
ncbi:MAG: hypothetical protein MUC86_00890 [Burkholderiaceae bacterium]|nr:hypothetical protein [Burkholderiaceae bacterium]